MFQNEMLYKAITSYINFVCDIINTYIKYSLDYIYIVKIDNI